jgi:hypothetical protein
MVGARGVVQCQSSQRGHTAGKANLVTEELTGPKPEEAKSRKAEGQSGEPGFPGM